MSEEIKLFVWMLRHKETGEPFWNADSCVWEDRQCALDAEEYEPGYEAVALYPDQTAEIERLRARVAELEIACVKAAIPLEAMEISRATSDMCNELQQGVRDGIKAVRAALATKEQNDDR